jgi:hypothetical protein
MPAVTLCDHCEPPIVCPMPGDCCASNPTPGCDREECCNLICIVRGDEFCCRGNWDNICARDAALYCPNICDCEQFGDMNADEALNLRDIAGFQNCFAGRAVAIGDVCGCGDYDADDDVDLADYKALLGLLTTP